jgi:glutamate---cysteine ligase / carboxylate-amine ligase
MLTVKDGELAVTNNSEYLALFDFPDRKCQVKELWQYLLESTTVDDADLNSKLKMTINNIIHNGPLARRIKQAIGKEIKRSHLVETYRRLCGCLATGQLFNGLD